jgi:polysaccharide pyruvyl transferase WcaK-like protein
MAGAKTTASLTPALGEQRDRPTPRIALLTPYTGGNLGDAAIQDAVIANLRLRLPLARFSGITLNSDNFLERHGSDAFPLSASARPFYGMCHRRLTDPPSEARSADPGSSEGRISILSAVTGRLKQVPLLRWCARRVRSVGGRVYGELRHCVQGYRFLQSQDLLVVSGGGQLDQEWGGSWGHPFSLFKWAVLARLARVPYFIASVGACKVNSTSSRFFLSAALRLARYRSYRDQNSKKIAIGLWRRAAADPVVPDIAFSMPSAQLPSPAGIRAIAGGRPVIAISPIAYAKPRAWVHEDAGLHERYQQEMARVISQLLHRDFFLVLVCSSVGDDDHLAPEILGRLDKASTEKAARQLDVPVIRSWKDLAALLQDADILVASRLHSVILGFITETPTVGISFDPKVDWVIQDLGLTDYLMHIRDFSAEDVIRALDSLRVSTRRVAAQIRSYRLGIDSAFTRQYDVLAGLAVASCERRIRR